MGHPREQPEQVLEVRRCVERRVPGVALHGLRLPTSLETDRVRAPPQRDQALSARATKAVARDAQRTVREVGDSQQVGRVDDGGDHRALVDGQAGSRWEKGEIQRGPPFTEAIREGPAQEEHLIDDGMCWA